jgi:hypothetical protein
MKVLHAMRPALFMLMVIFAEIAFKADQKVGIISYGILFIAGLITYLLWQDNFLGALLAIPLLRLVGSGIAASFEVKLLILSVLLLVYIVVVHLHAPFDFLHRTMRPLGIFLAIGLGVVFGLAMQRVSSFGQNSLLVTAVLCAALAEEVLRASLLSVQRKAGMIVLSSLLFGLLVSGSFLVLGLGFLFSIAASFLYVKEKHLFLPVIAHMIAAIIMVMPKFF